MTQLRILIVGAMDSELNNVLHYFNCQKMNKFQNYYRFWLAQKNQDYELGVLQTFVGDTNAAVATTLALESFKPDYVFKIGCVGGNSHGLHVGDLLLPQGFFHSGSWITRSIKNNIPTKNSATWQSVFGKLPYQVNSDNLGSHPYFIKPDSKLVDSFKKFFVDQKFDPVPCYIGGGNMWFFDKTLMKNVSKTHIPGNREDRVWGADMESYSIVQACSVFDTPFFGFYKISNSDFYNEPYIPKEVAKLFDLTFINKLDKFICSLI